jgi:hypothetical protein
MNEEGKTFKKVYAIKIQSSSNFINAIQVAYEVENGSIISGKNHRVVNNLKKESKKDFKEDVFEIKGEDYITYIAGTLGKKKKKK